MATERLAELLSELKLRSGRSYEALGRRTGMSRSTVHRYCRGEIVPDSYGPLERIAKACGATKEELDELYRRWSQAAEASQPDELDASADPVGRPTPEVASAPVAYAARAVSAGSAGSAGAVTPAEFEGTTYPSDNRNSVSISSYGPPEVVSLRRRYASARQRLVVIGPWLAIVCLVALTASAPMASRSARQAHAVAQWITGPAWVSPPAPVPRTLFGVTLNSSTGTMPGFRVGAVRLWDSGTRWAEIQPRRGEFDWTVLDRHVAGAREAGLPVLFVLGGTPEWASPGGPPAPYPDGTRASSPDSLADWDAFVRALVKRYHGRIEAYELWVLATDPRFYSGSIENLVEMTRRASRIIRAEDPRATLVCPGMGSLWSREGQDVLRRFAHLGGYGFCDVAGIKLYQRSASDPPESMLALAATVDRVLHEAGIQPRLWSTGTTYSITLERPLDEQKARDYAVRFFLTGLYARKANLERMYFYNWGGTKIPIVLQAEGGAPTRAALAVEQLQRWLARAESRSCGNGLAINLSENVWQCEFTITGPEHRYTATIRWAVTGTADTTAGPKATMVRRLDGSAEVVRPGDTVTVTEEPILIEDHP
ncbi:helix-turn-helix domain-containing protein [Nonomuraea wenchangensis]|uniref:helix-turn-helix domain-containing protein n=1 Tax=Nonomuraea wenchangensis TaxID=568860 RepID=UPI0034129E66